MYYQKWPLLVTIISRSDWALYHDECISRWNIRHVISGCDCKSYDHYPFYQIYQTSHHCNAHFLSVPCGGGHCVIVLGYDQSDHGTAAAAPSCISRGRGLQALTVFGTYSWFEVNYPTKVEVSAFSLKFWCYYHCCCFQKKSL